MDGSTYRPQREEPPDQEVSSRDRPAFILLLILSILAGGAFFFLHRQQALDLLDCLTGTGQSCRAAAESSPP